jgi:hypothetical protein
LIDKHVPGRNTSIWRNPVRTHRSTVLLGVLAAGLVLTQQACASVNRPGGEPVAFTAPTAKGTPSAGSKTSGSKTSIGAKTSSGTKTSGTVKKSGAAKTDPILAGKRQIVIKPVQATESIVALDERGRLILTDGEAEHGMFVLTPSGGKYLIKTAKAGAGGEAACLGIKHNGSKPLTVEAAACDAGRSGQLFTIARLQDKDKQGRPTYAISNQGAFLRIAHSGLIAEELGDAPLTTTYAFVDNGPATLPILD